MVGLKSGFSKMRTKASIVKQMVYINFFKQLSVNKKKRNEIVYLEEEA